MIGISRVSGGFVFLISILAMPVLADESAEPVTADHVARRMAAADQLRASKLNGYTGTRTYSVENKRFKVHATMKVAVAVDHSGVKTFRVIEISGPGAIRKMVLQRMLDTESKASQKTERAATQISPENYVFRLADTTTENGRKSYVLDAEPKTSNQLLFRGRIWVDAVDYAVTRIEGSPAKNPSFWVKKTRFVHTYSKVGDWWLGLSNHSESEVRMFGSSITRIEYSDYQLAPPAADSVAAQ